MDSVITIAANGPLAWAAGMRVGINASGAAGLASVCSADATVGTRLLRILPETALAKTLCMHALPPADDPAAAALICAQRALAVAIVCPHCGSRLMEMGVSEKNAANLPPAQYIFCTGCGPQRGIYVEHKTTAMPEHMLDLSQLVCAWRGWALSESASPQDWACGRCAEKNACYADDRPLALQRLAVFSFVPYTPLLLDYYPWCYADLALWLAGGPIPSSAYPDISGLTAPWQNTSLDTRERLFLKLNLFDAVVAALQDMVSEYGQVPELELEKTRVMIAGGRSLPHFSVQIPRVTPGAEQIANVPKKILRQTSAKFQVTQVGTAEQPRIEGAINFAPDTPKLRVGDTINVILRKEDGLPSDCTLTFRCATYQGGGVWQVATAEPVATALLQYFRILRVVPAFTVQAEIAILPEHMPHSATWKSALGKLWLSTLLVNKAQAHSQVVASIEEKLSQIPDDATSAAATQFINNLPVCAMRNVHYTSLDDDGVPPSVWNRAIYLGLHLLSDHENSLFAGGDTQILSLIRQQIAACSSMQVSVSARVEDSDEELLTILRELSLDTNLLMTGGVPAKNVRGDSWARAPAANPGMDAKVSLKRDEMARGNTQTSNRVAPEVNLDETMVMSRAEMQQQSKSPPSPSPPRAKVNISHVEEPALDETIVISRGPKSR